MLQTKDKFKQLVQYAENQAKNSPNLYKLYVLSFTVFGYLMMFSMVSLIALSVSSLLNYSLSLASLSFPILTNNTFILSMVLVAMLIRILFVRVDAPKGYVLDPQRNSELFKYIGALRKQLKLPKVHQVIVDSEFNAAMVQHPRFGMMFWQKNTLVLGLPLLLSLSKEQAGAVIAHEFGHLAGNHSRLNGWVYRTRETWGRITHICETKDNKLFKIIEHFSCWYAVYFNAFTFAWARRNEYEADKVAATLTSPEATSLALTSTRVLSEIQDEYFWQPIYSQADKERVPKAGPFRSLQSFCKTFMVQAEDIKHRTRVAIQTKTGYVDTHPSLRDRISALQVPVFIPKVIVKESAGEAWLDAGDLNKIIDEFDQQWIVQNRFNWKSRYDYVQATRKKLECLKSLPVNDLSRQQLWQLANWTEELEPSTDPLPLYLRYKLLSKDDCDDVDLAIARVMLNRGDKRGLRYVEYVLTNYRLALPACELAYHFSRQTGDAELMELWRQRVDHYSSVQDPARKERFGLVSTDHIIPCTLPAAELISLRKELLDLPAVKEVWIAQKMVKHFPANPIYVLAYTSQGKSFGAVSSAKEDLILDVNWPGDVFVVSSLGFKRSLRKDVILRGVRIK